MTAYAKYELLKAAWIKQHPAATPTEYAAACNRIARELGL